MSKRVPFTRRLYYDLQHKGYTHMRMLGIEKPVEKKPDWSDDDFILQPIKGDISKLYEEANIDIEDITGSDVKEMLDPPDGITFWIELPDTYLQSNNQNNPG